MSVILSCKIMMPQILSVLQYTQVYCRANQEWQWRNTLITIAK